MFWPACQPLLRVSRNSTVLILSRNTMTLMLLIRISYSTENKGGTEGEHNGSSQIMHGSSQMGLVGGLDSAYLRGSPKAACLRVAVPSRDRSLTP